MGMHSEVTVLSVNPDELNKESAIALSSVLDGAERLNMMAFSNKNARGQYIVSHVLLRVLLSSYWPILPSEWRFERTNLGQIFVINPQQTDPLFFSLSHTESLAICAVSTSCRIGVDAEKVDTYLDFLPLLPLILSEDECVIWHRGVSAWRLRRFYQLWTLKEALLKAVGLGFSLSPRCISFGLCDERPPEIRSLPSEIGTRDEWAFRVFEHNHMHVCALAACVAPDRLLHLSINHIGLNELINSAFGTPLAISDPRKGTSSTVLSAVLTS